MDAAPLHSPAFRRRRFLNWFPMGLTYAFLYMARYNLTVAKNALGDLMSKEDFGIIFGVGTFVYAVSFLLNGPLTDKLGGKKAILASALGAAVANLAMGFFIRSTLVTPDALGVDLVVAMSVLYAVNMYFQSAAAVAIVKVNASWFHVRERGGFSGIFGTMISSGVFFAFSVNEWLLSLTKWLNPAGTAMPWWVFFVPACLLLGMAALEAFLLKDRPGQAGHADFDTGDASSGMAEDVPLSRIVKGVLTNPIILTVAFVEFCTGVLRNGVMHWFPIYAKESLSLPADHVLRGGSWDRWPLIVAALVVGIAVMVVGSRMASGRRRAIVISAGALVALAPFLQAGWGGWLFVAGVVGANAAGWVSDKVFHSRRAPAAALLYVIVLVFTIAMLPGIYKRPAVVGWADEAKVPLKVGDRILAVDDPHPDIRQADDPGWNWNRVSNAIKCIPSACQGEGVRWDLARCLCTRTPESPAPAPIAGDDKILFTIEREGRVLDVSMADPVAMAKAGDQRFLPMGPAEDWQLWLLGISVFLISLGVIGTHGVLSGTATMDFGGRKGAATAVGMIDGFVYLGTAVQSVSLGYLTSRDWTFWPLFLIPFAILGLVLLKRIWHAVPKGGGGH